MRLSIDLDGVSQLRLLMAYFTLKRYTDKVEVHFTSVENGRENYHISAYGLPDVSEQYQYELRAMLGDDEYRVWLDQRLHGKPEMVLFSRRVKFNPKTQRWERRYRCRLSSILWKPFWSRVPRAILMRAHRKTKKRA